MTRPTMSLRLEDDLSCTICRDIFRDPVVLPCSHSYCKACLQSWWSGKKILECPVCKRRSSTNELTCNLVLKTICETVLKKMEDRALREQEGFCDLHFLEFKHYCLYEQKSLCTGCLESGEHNGHNIAPIEEVSRQLRKELRELVQPLKDKRKLIEEAKDSYDQTAEHIKVQAEHTEAQIREQFRKIQMFLEKEEEARIQALREEQQRKSQAIQEKIESLRSDIATLSETINAAEATLQKGDGSFLQGYTAVVKYVKESPVPDSLQPASGALIDEAKHRGNLIFKVWKKMKTMVHYTPVVLDPNTANAELSLSEDLMTVSCGPRQNIPDNPERFDCFRIVLGSKGLKSGTHSWDVEIGHNTNWFVGFASEGVLRKGKHPSCLWRIGCIDGKYTARSLSDPSTLLPWIAELHRVRVFLDWDRGKLVFYDLDTNTHIYTFTHRFTEKLFPYFNTAGEQPMRILSEPLCIGKS